MKKISYKSIAIASLSILSCPALFAAANFQTSSLPDRYNSSVAKPAREFRGQLPWGASEGTRLFGNLTPGKRYAAVDDPVKAFSWLETFDYLEGPDGSTWFYTAEYEKEYVDVSEWFTEENIIAYTFTIYDSKLNLVGTISDKVSFNPGETRVAHAVLDPAVSRNFFNSDSNPEVIVYLAMNTSDELGYAVNYYNKVYSIGGEKDVDGNDVCIDVYSGRCVDVFNSAAPGQPENFFYTFVEDRYPDPLDFDDYLDYINSIKTNVTTYSKSEGDAAPKVILDKDIYMSRYPGDTSDGMYLITKSVDGTPYFIFSFYEKPYFLDPTGFATDESATPDNNLVIETYAFSENCEKVSSTKIPVELPQVQGQISYTFYSIGSVTWKNDIDMTVNGTPSAPAYLVARDFTTAANPDDVTSSYDMFDNAGRLIHNVALDSDGIIVLNSAPGEEPHALFIYKEEGGAFTFNFIDLYSASKIMSIPQIYEELYLTASCQRVADRNGDYLYAFELRYDDTDAEGNDLKQIAWFDQKGNLARIDKINMGKDIMASSVNMFAECLSPYLYDDDDAMEYAVLVKRVSGNTTKNEFLVVDDNGNWYARFSDEDGKGNPIMFSIIPGESNILEMVYDAEDYYNIDFYNLPFTVNSGIQGVGPDNTLSAAGFVYDGQTVTAHGFLIEVYCIGGALVANGYDSLSIAALPGGVYVATISDEAGTTHTVKILK